MYACLIHHLLFLFANNHHDHHLLISWYKAQQPGMPGSWYSGYVRYLVRTYPTSMQHCLTVLQHHHTTATALNVCP